MPKFNIGDAVVVVEHEMNDDVSMEYIGETGVVLEEDDVPYVKMDLDGHIEPFCEEELELIQEQS